MIVDEAIIEGCIACKRSSQNLLYKKYGSTMFGVCMRYARSRVEAEDILQEGFLKVFDNIASFRGEGSFEGWIKRIMINHSLNHRRKNIRSPYLENIEEINELDITQEGEEEKEFVTIPTDTMLEMIRKMPEGYKTVFNLYVFEDFSHKEIAGMLGITESTSKTQLLKARRNLRNQLELLKLKK